MLFNMCLDQNESNNKFSLICGVKFIENQSILQNLSQYCEVTSFNFQYYLYQNIIMIFIFNN